MRLPIILQVFVLMIPPLLHPNFGAVPVRPLQIAHAGGQPEHNLQLFGREIIFEVFQRSNLCEQGT